MTTKITEQNISELANAGVNWQSVFTGDGSTGLTAVAGRGYFIDTTSGTVTVTLPASPSAGDVVVLKDYARTWNTNNVTLASTLLDGTTTSSTFDTQGQTVTLVYMDGTKGWSLVNEDTTSTLVPANFISATGGTVTTSGDFKIHTFTGDGCFAVSTVGNSPVNPLGGPENVDYLVIAGGGGGGRGIGGAGGGGAGGYRTTFPSPGCNAGAFPITATTYPITVGGGGNFPTPGSPSVFSTITSTGGGTGGGPCGPAGQNGGSGGGGAGTSYDEAGSGNTPPVSPPQGNNGGTGTYSQPNTGCTATQTGGGGGGANAAGQNAPGPAPGPKCAGSGGNGIESTITGSGVTRGGGGGGGAADAPGGANQGNRALGGSGGGGNGTDSRNVGSSGSANTGGGGGGNGYPNPTGTPNTNGGKGLVVIRYKFQ